MTITEKVFVVTGAGNGIGKALVKELLASGARVAAVDRSEQGLGTLAAEVGNTDILSTYIVDISDKNKVDKMSEEVASKFGPVDGLINCAGIIQPFKKINDLDYSSIDRVMDVNFYGTVFMTKTFLPQLLTRPNACVVNFSSMGGFLPVPGQGIYGASKAAVKLFTEALYAELLDTNVQVSVVFPGATSTNISQNSGVDISKLSNKSTKQYSMLSAEKVAQIVVKGIRNGKPRIYTGSDSRFMNLLYRIAPNFAVKYIANKMKDLL